ncbi:MAG: alpha/beta hydrolase [Sporichthyaceae bacterium]
MNPPAWTREDVEFEVEGATCAAWWYRPAGANGPLPCVVMAHGFGMTRECRLPAWAEAFAEAGLAVLLFDYRGFGASGGHPRQLLDVAMQRRDWVAAVAAARAFTGVDPDRVVLWGTSFSGGHVLHVGARDNRIAAVIAQVPFTDGRAGLRGGSGSWRLRSARGRARLRATAGSVRSALADVRSRRRGRPPLLVPVAGELGSGAVIAGPGAEAALRMLVPDGTVWRNEVNAAVILDVLRDRPGRDAARITAPLFVATCTGDRVTPEAPAIAAVRSAPHGEHRSYPFNHFEAYVGAGRAALIADELDFLRRHGLAE